jgi:hypothetical protein
MDKERYRMKPVFTIDGVPVPHLYQRLGKYYVKIFAPKGDKISQVIIPLKEVELNEAIAKTIFLIGRCAVARARFKLKPKKPEEEGTKGHK